MAGFTWPGANAGTVSPVLNSPSAHPTVTSPASDGGAFFSSEVSTSATGFVVVTSTAPDPDVFFSSDVPTSTSTASDGGAFFSSDIPISTVGSHTSAHCLPTAHLDNPLNPNVAPPIDAVPSSVDYGTLPTALPEAVGLSFDHGTPFEMPDLTAPATKMPTGLSSDFTKRDVPRIAANPDPILGVVIVILGIVLALFLLVKYCIRRSSESQDLERGDYPHTRGRHRHRDGSPPATRPDDIPVSEGYGMDPVDLGRAQSWQEGLSEKGVR
ncbi:hypothetical protein G6011_00326 [Alternaria panax]|uniref:Uncharacterized protein n=1 Tax=Alternaria panax TaxID=48097 RepID=A0AAD4IHY4_9PLEO|nr:hypothetical protein G6011_00326 [Alternaria panax]